MYVSKLLGLPKLKCYVSPCIPSLQIPISPGREDFVAWHHNKNELFSVRSAYHCQWESKYGTRGNAQQAGRATSSQAWKTLWKLQVPRKIKISGWRALKGLIPCRVVLANRHVGGTGGCPICNRGAEDIKHKRAKEVWKELGIWEKIEHLLTTDRSGFVILEGVIRRGEQVHGLEVGLTELRLIGGW
jgi:hypothetical protein